MRPSQSKSKRHVFIYSVILLGSTILHLGCGHIAYSEEEIYYKKPSPVYSVGQVYYSGPKPYYDSDIYQDKIATWKMEQEKTRLQKQEAYGGYSDMSYGGATGKCVAWDDYGSCVKKAY